MPAQLSTILYVSEYKEKTSSGFYVANAIGYTRLEKDGDKVQKFNITAFYPIDDSKPCYIPKMIEGQVLSVSNSKFNKGANGELDVSWLKKIFFYPAYFFILHNFLFTLFFYFFLANFNISFNFKYSS